MVETVPGKTGKRSNQHVRYNAQATTYECQRLQTNNIRNMHRVSLSRDTVVVHPL